MVGMTVRKEQMSAISVNVKSNSGILYLTNIQYMYYNTKAPVMNHYKKYVNAFSVTEHNAYCTKFGV